MSLPPELAFVFGDISNVFHRTRLVSREMVAESTLALTIERPEGFVFLPGQNTTVSLPGARADDLREFTLASAPSDANLVIAMRARNSEFKDACYALKPGDAIMVRDPAGTLWEKTDASQVWLSGGIGITPFRSIIRELVHDGSPLAVTHIHSDRSRETVPFLQEFESLAATNSGYIFFPTITRSTGQGMEKGRITGSTIMSHAPQYIESYFFIAGTDSFVASMREAIIALGVPADRIRTEKFEGYKRHNA